MPGRSEERIPTKRERQRVQTSSRLGLPMVGPDHATARDRNEEDPVGIATYPPSRGEAGCALLRHNAPGKAREWG